MRGELGQDPAKVLLSKQNSTKSAEHCKELQYDKDQNDEIIDAFGKMTSSLQ